MTTERSSGRDGLTTVREAAAYMGLSRAAVYRLMGNGELPYAKLGQARRLRWADVLAYVERCMVNA